LVEIVYIIRAEVYISVLQNGKWWKLIRYITLVK